MTDIAAKLIVARRLDLVPLRVEHAGEMTGVLADPALYYFTGGAPPTEQELRIRYERWFAGSPDPETTWCNWVIRLRTSGQLAGTVQATIIQDGETSAAEVAWVVGTPWQGQGLATEAASALVLWLRQDAARTVIAHIHPRHRASAAVAIAAGLRPTAQWQDGEIRYEVQERV